MSLSFRARITLAVALAAAGAIALASVAVFYVVKRELREQVDRTLEARTAGFARLPRPIGLRSGGRFPHVPPPRSGDAVGYVQLIGPDGRSVRPSSQQAALPVTSGAESVLVGRRTAVFEDRDVAGVPVRLLTTRLRNGYVVQTARSLEETEDVLGRLKLFLGGIGLAGVGGAAALALLVSGRVLAPVRRLTNATERVAATGDLAERIEVRGHDEVSRLAASFNAMMGALEHAEQSQKQLVADASHELRTPLTSLRTNIEVLARNHSLPAGEREALLRDVTDQLDEMTALVAELVELARGYEPAEELEPVRLDLVVADALERARRRTPQTEFAARLEETTVLGVRSRLERAVLNLLDNAAKWSPPGAVVDVDTSAGQVVIRDRGPGIDEADAPYVFDRFYRAASARGMPGSGLGLSIVRQVAEEHGGTVALEPSTAGGTSVRLAFEPL